MNTLQTTETPTIRTHKRQFIWQILAPFLVVTVFILVVAGLVIAGGASGNRTWADISVIWLLLPMLVLILLLAGLVSGLVYGLARLLQVAPRYTRLVQSYVAMVPVFVRRIADGTAQPILWVQQAGAVLKSIFKH